MSEHATTEDCASRRDLSAAPPTDAVLWLGILGAMIGVAIVLWGFWSWPPESRRLMSSGPFALWASLFAAQTLLLTFVSIAAIGVISRRRTMFRDAWREIFLTSAAFAAVLVATRSVVREALPNLPYVPRAEWRTTGLLIFGGLVALAAGWGLLLTRRAVLKLKEDSVESRLEDFASCRKDVERLVGLLGGAIALLVLATAAQRRAVLWFTENLTSAEEKKLARYLPYEYPSEYVLVYGLIFTVVLALGVLPTLATLQHTGQELLKGASSAEQRKEWSARHRLELAPSEVFRASVAILAPLLGSLASLLPEVT